MPHLSHAVLLRAHRFLLEIHAATDLGVLRTLIPDGLARQIACDRAAFNEFDLGGRHPTIRPNPEPAYWRRLSPILSAHLHEHRLADPRTLPPRHLAMSFGDWRNDPLWNKSTLFQEYYLPAGARHQLAVHVFEIGTVRLLMNCNRARRDFTDEERLLIELLSPHVAYAWRNASEMERLQLQRQSAPVGDALPGEQHSLVIDSHRNVVTALSSGAGHAVQRYFGSDVSEGRVLPLPLHLWSIAQRRRLASAEALPKPPEPLPVQSAAGVLVARLLHATPTMDIILLEESPAPRRSVAPTAASLTQRESEILHWIREGKRNGEIATILGISVRTVGKHVEHLFEKLGVETRTAAARAGMQSNLPPPAVTAHRAPPDEHPG